MSEPRTDAGRALLETVAHGGVKCGNESGWCHMSDVALLRKGLPTVEDEAAALERKTSIAAQEAINEIHMGIEAELMKQIAALSPDAPDLVAAHSYALDKHSFCDECYMEQQRREKEGARIV